MFRTQKKSFNLINEEDTKKTKDHECGFLRFLVVPCLICFALLLVLVNVDFSAKADSTYETTITPPTENMSSTLITDEIINVTRLSAANNAAPFANLCEEVNKNKCKLNCKSILSSQQKALNNELQQRYQACQSPLDVVLNIAFFQLSEFRKPDLDGSFSLMNLTFINCYLDNIAFNAFDKESTKTLENLIITPSKLNVVTEKTFAGLRNLRYFKWHNDPRNGQLAGIAFLKPMAFTLQELEFKQSYLAEAGQQVFDPGNWLKGAYFGALKKVDFQGNYFKSTLRKTSFESLNKVETLILNKCNIESMAMDTFDPIMDTLKYLDLGGNFLKTLSPHFIDQLTGTNVNVELNLALNQWSCACDNIAMIKAVQSDAIKLATEPKCFPEGQNMKQIQICCVSMEENCVITTPTTITTTESTTATIKSTWDTTMPSTENSTESHSTATTTKSTVDTTMQTTESSSAPYPSIELECKKYFNEAVNTANVNEQLIKFKITTISSTSISLTFQAIPAGATLLYFNNQKSDTGKSENLQHVMTVENLKADETYIFCAVPYDSDLMSPFNCRAHYMGEPKISKLIEPWLKSADIVLFVTYTTIGYVVFFTIGMLSIYLLVRWRPTLLRNNKRLIRLSPESKKVFLKKSRSTLTADEAHEAMRAHAADAQMDFSDYVPYYHSAELPSTRIQAFSPYENLPPHLPAPALPPFGAIRPISEQSTIPADDVVYRTVEQEFFEEHVYQSLNDYQKIYAINFPKKSA